VLWGHIFSVGPKAFETSWSKPKAFQRVKALDPKALAEYFVPNSDLLCIYEIGTIFVKTMHHTRHHCPQLLHRQADHPPTALPKLALALLPCQVV
jgi:hypothetical protein